MRKAKNGSQTVELQAFDDEIRDLEFDHDPAKKYATAYDLRDMDALGIVPTFRRRFNFLAMMGFSSTVLTAWETSLATFSFALYNGGTGGLFCVSCFPRTYSTSHELIALFRDLDLRSRRTYLCIPHDCGARFIVSLSLLSTHPRLTLAVQVSHRLWAIPVGCKLIAG